jgi:hypothetical protein
MKNKMQEIRIKNEEKMQKQKELEEQRQKEIYVILLIFLFEILFLTILTAQTKAKRGGATYRGAKEAKDTGGGS